MGNKDQLSRLNSVGKDEPLLVLKYVPWRIVWRLFFPYSIAMPIFYMIVFHWAPRGPVSFKTVFSEIVGILVLVGGACFIVDMLFMKDFRLYRNRVEKTYRLFGKKQVLLDGADLKIYGTYWRKIYAIPKGNYYSRFRKRVSFDCNLCGSKCIEDFTVAIKVLGIEFPGSFS